MNSAAHLLRGLRLKAGRGRIAGYVPGLTINAAWGAGASVLLRAWSAAPGRGSVPRSALQDSLALVVCRRHGFLGAPNSRSLGPDHTKAVISTGMPEWEKRSYWDRCATLYSLYSGGMVRIVRVVEAMASAPDGP